MTTQQQRAASRVSSPSGLAVAFSHAAIAECRAGRLSLSQALVRQASLLDPANMTILELRGLLAATVEEEAGRESGAGSELMAAIAALRLDPPDQSLAVRIVAGARARGDESNGLRQLERLLADMKEAPEKNPRLKQRVFQGAFATLCVTLGFIAGHSTRPEPMVAPSVALQVPVALPNSSGAADVTRLANAIEAVLGGNDLEILRVRQGLDSLSGVPALIAQVKRLSVPASKRQYQAARRSHAAGDTDEAVHQLQLALPALRGTWLEDDALYLLAVDLAGSGDLGAAQMVAQSLLRDHPNSIFANSRIKSLAREVNP